MARHCPECGFVNAEGANYCSRCGAFIGQPEPARDPQSTTATYVIDESGARVRVETMVARGVERLRLAGAPEGEIPESLKAVEAAVKTRGPGPHPLTGPIYVSGAEPGDSLEVRIGPIEFLHPYGVIGFLPGGGTLPAEFPYAF